MLGPVLAHLDRDVGRPEGEADRLDRLDQPAADAEALVGRTDGDMEDLQGAALPAVADRADGVGVGEGHEEGDAAAHHRVEILDARDAGRQVPPTALGGAVQDLVDLLGVTAGHDRDHGGKRLRTVRHWTSCRGRRSTLIAFT